MSYDVQAIRAKLLASTNPLTDPWFHAEFPDWEEWQRDHVDMWPHWVSAHSDDVVPDAWAFGEPTAPNRHPCA